MLKACPGLTELQACGNNWQTRDLVQPPPGFSGGDGYDSDGGGSNEGCLPRHRYCLVFCLFF